MKDESAKIQEIIKELEPSEILGVVQNADVRIDAHKELRQSMQAVHTESETENKKTRKNKSKTNRFVDNKLKMLEKNI